MIHIKKYSKYQEPYYVHFYHNLLLPCEQKFDGTTTLASDNLYNSKVATKNTHSTLASRVYHMYYATTISKEKITTYILGLDKQRYCYLYNEKYNSSIYMEFSDFMYISGTKSGVD